MGRIDYDMRFRVLLRDEFRCAYCGRSAADDGVSIEVDHLVPVAQGGVTRPDNLVAACHDCNVGKASAALDPSVIEQIISTRRKAARRRSPGVRYGADVLMTVANLRSEGFGYKAIARELGVSRDTARYLVERSSRLGVET